MNQINQINKTNQMNQTDQIDRTDQINRYYKEGAAAPGLAEPGLPWR
jgi:hypothetical protein